MVLVGMRDQHTEQAVVWFPETRNGGKQALVPVLRRIQRQADIQRDAFPLGLDLDASAADLTGSTMDANPHALPRMS